MAIPSFSEFDPAGKEQWQSQAQKELGENFRERIQWHITPGLTVPAYNTIDELDAEQTRQMQDCQKTAPGWLNLPRISYTDPNHTNKLVDEALKNGADGVFIDFGKKHLSVEEITRLLHRIKLNNNPVYFETDQPVSQLYPAISNHTGYVIRGGVAFDPVANWMRTGVSFQEVLRPSMEFIKSGEYAGNFRTLMVESHLYHNNGADPVQELGLTISALVTYLDKLTDAGISALQAFNSIFTSVSIGTHYLSEIAKLRALRALLRKIALAYDLPPESAIPFIHAKTSSFYHCNASYTNMIRAGSEAMSAVIGGCDALTVQGFQVSGTETSPLSARIARNVSSILSYESAFDVVADPAAGSYSIENMSAAIAGAAWEYFLQLEERGGLIACFEQGFVQKELSVSFQQRLDELSNGRTMIGVNKFTEKESALTPTENPVRHAHFLVDQNLSESFLKRIKL
jgi:methylmalonyl-CoA mutase